MVKNNMPKISVITPVYNAERYIEKSLKALLEQTLEDLEFIIIDDGSIDNSLKLIYKILEQYSDRQEECIIISRDNKGVAATRAEGVNLAKGDYIIHFDSDDFADKNMLNEMYNLALNENADIVICDYFISKQGENIYVPQNIPKDNIGCIKKILEGELHGASWNKLIKRDLYTTHNINYTPNVNYLEDVLFNVKCFFFAKKIVHLNKAYYYYNKDNDNSITSSINESKINSINESISLIHQFLQLQNLNSVSENELNILKLNQKSWFISSNKNHTTKKIWALYPESRKKILNTKKKLYMKILLLTSSYGLYRLSALMLKLFVFLNKKIKSL